MPDRLQEILARARARKAAAEGRTTFPSASEAFAYGAADALFMGGYDEAQAGGAGVKEHWQAITDPEFLRAYLEALKKARPEEQARLTAIFNKALLRKDIAKGQEAVRKTRKKMEAAREAHPFAFTGGQLAGSVPWSLMVGKVMPAGPMTLGKRIGIEALAGAATGAAYGAASEDENRLSGALTGGAFGGAVGAAFPLLRAGIRKGMESIARVMKPTPVPAFPERGVSRDAARLVMKEIMQGDSIDDVMERAALAGKNLGTLMDASPAAARLAKGIYQTDVPVRSKLWKFLTERSAKSYERASGVMDELLGKPTSTRQLVEKLTQRAYEQARPFYRLAEMQEVPVDLIADLAKRPAFRSALRKALAMAANEGVQLDDAAKAAAQALLKGKEPEVGALPIKVIDYIQRALNDKIMAARGKVPNTARVMSGIRDELLKRVDDYVPAFRTARGIARSKFDLERAIQAGESIMNPNVMPEDVAAQMARMSEAERAAMKQGIRNVLRQRLENVINPNIAAERLSKRPLVAKKLQAALGKKADELLRTIDREALFRQTRDIVTAGSHTAQNVASKFHPIEQGARGYVRQFIEWLTENGRDLSRRELASAVADLLMDAGEMRDAVLKSLKEALKSEEAVQALGKKTATWLRKHVQAQLVIPAGQDKVKGK